MNTIKIMALEAIKQSLVGVIAQLDLMIELIKHTKKGVKKDFFIR